ncbi:MAG: type II toxin-antitoxin system Phd/YefM family antitoxin [Bacillota bacterium]|nr:type II toxin-antitoxin system Phd/YefM family antitoxin [Bacillota bacterium]
MNLANLANEGRAIEMKQVNIFDAKTELSKLIKMLETNEEDKIVIARNGVPVAQILPYTNKDVSKRIGLGKGVLPNINFDAMLDDEDFDSGKIINWESLDEDFT